MEELGNMWAYEESVDEMKNRLLCTTLELESVKMEADKEKKKYEDSVKHLLGLLKVAYQERDDARNQLQKLLDNLGPLNPSIDYLGLGLGLGPGPGPGFSLGPLSDSFLVTAKANSSLTESNNSHSPVDSFLDTVSSPDSTNLLFVNQRPNGFIQEFGAEPLLQPTTDPGSRGIDDLAKGKVLPQKGRLLSAVMEAGPLLQTLLVAGPLPRWRNPPPLQPLRIQPMVSMKGIEPSDTSHRPFLGPNGIISQKPLSFEPYHDIPRSNPQMCSASMLGFMGNSGFPYNSSHLLSSAQSSHIPLSKRPRFQ